MIRILAESALQLLFVLPIVLLTLKNRKLETVKILVAFTAFYLLNQVLLYLPFIYPDLKISNWNTNWNWSGKTYAIIGALLFLAVYRKFPVSDYFLNFKQDRQFLKQGISLVIIILIIQSIVAFFSPSKSVNFETLFFQFTMPGINEEIAYRGIMLGLLVKILKSKNLILNPALWITSILFGMAHGFYLTKDFNIIFDFQPFTVTMIYGLLWGWITLKSRSILLALISHNLVNGMMNLIQMR